MNALRIAPVCLPFFQICLGVESTPVYIDRLGNLTVESSLEGTEQSLGAWQQYLRGKRELAISLLSKRMKAGDLSAYIVRTRIAIATNKRKELADEIQVELRDRVIRKSLELKGSRIVGMFYALTMLQLRGEKSSPVQLQYWGALRNRLPQFERASPNEKIVLASLYFQLDELGLARKLGETLVRNYPERPDIHSLVAWFYTVGHGPMRNGRGEVVTAAVDIDSVRAKKLVQRAMDLDPKYPNAHFMKSFLFGSEFKRDALQNFLRLAPPSHPLVDNAKRELAKTG